MLALILSKCILVSTQLAVQVLILQRFMQTFSIKHVNSPTSAAVGLFVHLNIAARVSLCSFVDTVFTEL